MKFFGPCDNVFGGANPIDVPIQYGGTLICDDRYLGLITIPRIALLGVKPGTNCQANLADYVRGFLFHDGSGLGAYTEPNPALNLAFFNPATGGVFSAPSSGFPNLLVGTGDNPSKWQFLAAPSTGTFSLVVSNGLFNLVGGGTIPGIGSVCGVSGAQYAGLIGCSPADGSGNFSLYKLNLTPNRAIVGWTDPSDNATRATTLPDTSALFHPIGDFTALSCHQFSMNDSSGDPISSGIPAWSSGVTDAAAAYYSPSNKSFYKFGPHTYKTVTTTSNSSTFGTTLTDITPHLDFGTVTLNYPNIEVDFQFSAHDGAMDCFVAALFIDGTQVFEWQIGDGTNDNAAVWDAAGSTIVTGLTPGSHSIVIKIATQASSGVYLKWSNANLKTLP